MRGAAAEPLRAAFPPQPASRPVLPGAGARPFIPHSPPQRITLRVGFWLERTPAWGGEELKSFSYYYDLFFFLLVDGNSLSYVKNRGNSLGQGGKSGRSRLASASLLYKAMAAGLPGSAPLQDYAVISSAFRLFSSSAAHNCIAGFTLFLRSPVSKQAPFPALFLLGRSPGTRDPLSQQKHLNVTYTEKVVYGSKMRGILNPLGISQMQIQWWKGKGSIKTRGLAIRL